MEKIKIYLKPFLNWKFLLCYTIPWAITNGIWYVCLTVSSILHIEWLKWLSASYIAFLYTPIAQEKIIIIPIALWLCKKIFKNDEKTIKDLDTMYKTAKSDFNKMINIFRRKK